MIFGTLSLNGGSVNVSEDSPMDLASVSSGTRTFGRRGDYRQRQDFGRRNHHARRRRGQRHYARHADGRFHGTVSVVSGRNVTLVDANAFDLGVSTVSGNLVVTASGAITDSGKIAVAGTTTLAAGAGNDITLDTPADDFTGAVSVVSGRNVTLVDANAFDLGVSTVWATSL